MTSVKMKEFTVVVQFAFPQTSILSRPVGNCGHMAKKKGGRKPPDDERRSAYGINWP
jgi:hypothetical protein